jgi:hypothetical protein
MDYGNDGFWSGTWGIIRSHQNLAANLFSLPQSQVPVVFTPATQAGFVGVCPASAPVRAFDISAVEANKVLPANPNVDHPGSVPERPRRRSPAGNGGTLVYNHRTTTVGGQTVTIEPEGADRRSADASGSAARPDGARLRADL